MVLIENIENEQGNRARSPDLLAQPRIGSRAWHAHRDQNPVLPKANDS